MALIDSLAQSIANMEGFGVTGSVAQRNNNPGNLTASPYATGNMNGYSVFPDVATGWQALDYQLSLYAGRGLTLEQMVDIYAPSGTSAMTKGNDPNNYLNYLVGQLGVGPSTTISSLYDETAPTATVSTDVSESIADDTNEAGFALSDFLSSGIFDGDGTIGTGGWIGIGLLGLAGIVLWVNR